MLDIFFFSKRGNIAIPVWVKYKKGQTDSNRETLYLALQCPIFER